jgi:hypothetical protein
VVHAGEHRHDPRQVVASLPAQLGGAEHQVFDVAGIELWRLRKHGIHHLNREIIVAACP